MNTIFEPLNIAPAPAPVINWKIYVGRFKTRLGMDALAIGASTHDACKAAREMLYDQKYVDLKGPDASMLLDLLIATSQPAANPMFAGSGPITAAKKLAILTTVPTADEQYRG